MLRVILTNVSTKTKQGSLCNGGTKVVRPRLGTPSAYVSPKSLPESARAPPLGLSRGCEVQHSREGPMAEGIGRGRATSRSWVWDLKYTLLGAHHVSLASGLRLAPALSSPQLEATFRKLILRHLCFISICWMQSPSGTPSCRFGGNRALKGEMTHPRSNCRFSGLAKAGSQI